ncbi:putative F-box associated interaction domain-containing protein [Helianthus annuus]|uniref:F-box associated interaction domain-containing protein n=1 Tax=Helianthus annuus TaxID=4232 RepID=A0A251UJQ7_HELAN|nr:F-box/LRR-repeat/kelch-repeat protein At2g27520 [Helianthus annuus]KAF5803836.1 putative F-box associated interaction domain-containing protein [Helianthus annuus]KAJ0561739.1 putative F-box associated interaction domain-containing protein [Helianthus annuus]KAJ0568488.1 putative F-box associated interaction domain-containing protein [Helianthus annuus]KAJ0574803.1 putative F-box associated interaction domain-containing protein [Helianthus annuus]KAJ0739134.1 putative F-box associated inter
MQYLLARYNDSVDFPEKYVLIADDHTFPQKRVSLNTHLLVNTLKYSRIIGCSHGLLCLYGGYQEGHDGPLSGSGRAVIWNPCIRKTVTVDVPNVADCSIYETVLSFGVCRKTNDSKILKITHINRWGHRKSLTCIPCHVEVFTLSTRAWRHLYGSNPPRNSIEFDYYNMVVLDGMINWLAIDRITVDGGLQSYNLIISFDMTSEEFREVNLPDSLAHQSLCDLSICKLRESLVVLERDVEANNLVFHVWIMEDVVPKSFTKLYAIDLPDADVSAVYVMGFRKTGEPIIDSASRYPEWTGSLAVYQPYSKTISSLGIDGDDFSYFVYSYMETLLLL